jgi:hypothetical protein
MSKAELMTRPLTPAARIGREICMDCARQIGAECDAIAGLSLHSLEAIGSGLVSQADARRLIEARNRVLLRGGRR